MNTTSLTAYLTLEETASIFRANPRTVRRWIKQGKIPFLKLGRRYLFRESELFALRTTAKKTREAIIA
jgi:excisionase family DNA binding protein